MALMTTWGYDPFGASVNGERASDADLEVMEHLAFDLLAPLPNERYKQYGYNLGEPILTFMTRESDDEASQGVYASARVAHGDYDEIMVDMVYDADNDLNELYLRDEDEAVRTARALTQAMIDSGELEPREIALTSFMNNTFSFMLGEVSATSYEASMAVQIGKLQLEAADLIRELVDEKAPHTVEVTEFSWPVDEHGELLIVRHTILGEEDVDGDIWIPHLQIDYRDLGRGFSYCYTREQDGARTLDTTALSDLVDRDFSDYTEEDEQVEELRELLGADIPGKHDVDLLTQKLIDAALADL